MASCLVPDFPAVMVALEHLKELDKQLKEEGIAFSPEASLHLTEITAAITDLEAERRAAHEHLEVETIENSKLRHQINNLRERMSQEIMADVVEARASNAEEIEQLRKDLHAVSQLREATAKRQVALLSQNEALSPEREQVKAEHEGIVAAQNDRIALKYSLQMHLDQTRDRIEELKSCTAAVQQDKIMLQRKMVLEREAFAVKNDRLSGEVEQAEEKIKQQKLVNRRSRIVLDSLNEKKRETHNQLGELMIDMAKLESQIRRLAADRLQCEKQLQVETQKHQELRQQREALKKELRELEEAFRVAIQLLKEEIATVEDKIEEARASRLLCQDALAKVYEIFKQQHDEENEVRAEHFHVSQQLQRSKLQLEERISSIVRHSKEIKEMDKQIGELLQAEIITKRVFERNREELCDNVDAEKKNICHYEAEKRRLTRLLEEGKRKQEEHVAKMSADIGNAKTRYQELQREEATLQKHQPKSENGDLLTSHVAQREAEYRQTETRQREEMEQCAAEAKSVARSREEKQREVEEKEEILKEVEANWNEERSRHQGLKTLTSELKRKKSDLELSIQGLKEKTDSLLQPKDQTKAELDEMRRGYMDVLRQQASELRAVEMSIYDNSVKLEQVRMENSRLHLCIQQMTEDVGAARENKERYWQEVGQLQRDIRALCESLEEAWREDLVVTQERQNSDGVLLASMGAMLNHLKTRRQQLGNVGTLLHQQMLAFSRRLGDKTTVEQQS
ncbi:coiled-coil domain-containing protein 175 [Sander lucioperca]|uniref:coiled-coil domain-containing protein 175 n=1 Tax=Sander lucioperca TaxID=283035 RepID=UPI00125E3687|nr:coiled-coil domain-containing protein 175 [Sander lucioperca]